MHYGTYRMIIKAKATPIIAITQVPIVPPTITGILSDEDRESLALFLASRKTKTKSTKLYKFTLYSYIKKTYSKIYTWSNYILYIKKN